MPAPVGGWRSTPCQLGRKRASARWSAGSISLRSAASDARRSRRSTSGSHHSRSRAAGPQLAAHQLAGALQPGEHGVEVDAVAVAQRAALERAVRAREAAHEPLQRVRARPRGTRRGGRRAARRRARRGTGRRPRPRSSAPRRRGAGRPRGARRSSSRQPRVERRARRDAHAQLGARQVADAAQHVVERVGGVGARALGQPLQVGLDRLQRARVDQVAQLLLAEQLAQQVAVERQRRRAPLGVGRVALVHVRRDVVEQQRGRERRRGRRLDLDHAQLARVQLAQQVLQARQVEHVAQALAVGLEDDRELRRSAWRPRAASATSAAAATAACAGRGRRAGSAARGRRSRGSARRTARCRPARRRRGPPARRARSASARRPAARRRRAGGR